MKRRHGRGCDCGLRPATERRSGLRELALDRIGLSGTIGRGGMSIVYEAKHVALERRRWR